MFASTCRLTWRSRLLLWRCFRVQDHWLVTTDSRRLVHSAAVGAGEPLRATAVTYHNMRYVHTKCIGGHACTFLRLVHKQECTCLDDNFVREWSERSARVPSGDVGRGLRLRFLPLVSPVGAPFIRRRSPFIRRRSSWSRSRNSRPPRSV